MYITKYGCVFLKLVESIYVAMDLIPILLGSLPLAHNAEHSLVIIPVSVNRNVHVTVRIADHVTYSHFSCTVRGMGHYDS